MDVLGNTDPNNLFFRCVEDSTEAIMITDTKGILVYVNPAWQEIYEYAWDDAIGHSPNLLRSGHQSKEFYQEMWRQILDPKVGYWKGDVVNRSKSGKEVPVLLTITPYRHSGKNQGYMGIAVDMREKKSMEAKILQQDRLASVGLLASGIAHEIGTPLNVIRGRAELLKFQGKGNETLESGLDIIITQIDRVSQLIRTLLNLSRGHQSPATGVCQVKRAASEATSLLGQKLREYGIELVDEIPEEAQIKIAHNKFVQVLLNLLINAIHAIGSETRKGVRIRGHKITLGYTENAKLASISVTDTGCGIERENLPNIFKPFFTTKPVGEGTGLGLSITYGIIAEVGGDLSVESRIGEGTRFIIDAPKV